MNRLFKACVLCTCAAALVACTQSGEVTSDMKTYGLVTPAREIFVTNTDSEFSYTVYFNRENNIDRIVTLNPDDSYRGTEQFNYDDHGRLETKYETDAEGEYSGRWAYLYDEGGQITDKVFFGVNNSDLHRFVYTYLEDGRIAEVEYRMEGETGSISRFSYDGLSKEEFAYEANGELFSHVTYEYLDSAMTKVVRMVGDNGELDIEIGYDASTLLPIWSRNVKFNSEGGFVWDDDMETNPERVFEYEFDRLGNWTERREYHTDKAEVLNTIKRRIRY